LGLIVTLLELVVIAALLLAATVGDPPVSVAAGMVQDAPAPESVTAELVIVHVV
jgi:hypothetical protein